MGQMSPNQCEYLSWDSEFFGLRIGRLFPKRLSVSALQNVKDWCRSNSIDCLYCLVDADDFETIRCIEQMLLRLVDVRITLSRSLAKHDFPKVNSTVRPAVASDLPILCSIARCSHQDSRFYSDSNFPRRKCDTLYETWVTKSFQGYADIVLVAEHENQAAGYITCKAIDGHVGQIGLLAVEGRAQGRGLGSALIGAALDWFKRNACEQATVVTQGRNVPAQRCYQRTGFVTESVQFWYHWWFSGTAAQVSTQQLVVTGDVYAG
jgi:GNAT superfamily N-acetyltransferase